MSPYDSIRRIFSLCPCYLITLLLVLSFSSSIASSQNRKDTSNTNGRDQHGSNNRGDSSSIFKPSKDLQELNGNNSNTVNTRYFQHNFNNNNNQFYNPTPSYNKYPNYFYPSPTIQQAPTVPSFIYPTGHPHGNYQRQIRVPGIIEIRLSGRDAEITCEFQRYLILIQGIYWHHNTEPYGSYFDTRNGFAPHVTVTNIDPWKSVLTIKDFNEDDYGPYKCISSAILPDDNNPHNHQYNSGGRNIYNNNNNFLYPEVRTNELEESKRKVRFTRDLKDSSSTHFNGVYDPFLNNYLGVNLQHGNLHQHTLPPPSLTPQHDYHIPTSNYPTHLNQNSYFPGHYNHNNNNNNNYLLNPGYFNLGGFNTNYNNHNHNNNPYFNNNHNQHHNSISNWSIHAPYYKPSFSVSTIYQEVNFAPQLPPLGSTSAPGK